MGRIITKRPEMPLAPAEYKDAVELYARETGRHGDLVFIPTETRLGKVVRGTWLARFTLRDSDPLLGLSQRQEVAKTPTEDVWFHTPNPLEGQPIPGTHGLREPAFKPLSIQEMGVSGIRTFLQKGNMWSGRGQYNSLEEQVQKVREQNKEAKEKNRSDAKEANRFDQRDRRRSRFKVPFIRVGIDLKNPKRSKRNV